MPIIVKNSAISSSTNLSFNTNTINFLANVYEFTGSINISESFNITKNYYYSPREGSILITSSLDNNLKSGSLIYNKNINALTFNTSNNTSSMSMGGLLCCYQGTNFKDLHNYIGTSSLLNFPNILSSSYNTDNVDNFVLNKKNYIFEWDFFEKGKELEIFLHFSNTIIETANATNNNRIVSLEHVDSKLYFTNKINAEKFTLFDFTNTIDYNNFNLDIFTGGAINTPVKFFTDLKFKLICTKKNSNNVYFNIITEYLLFHNKLDTIASDNTSNYNGLYNSFAYKENVILSKNLGFPGFFDFDLKLLSDINFNKTRFNHMFSYIIAK